MTARLAAGVLVSALVRRVHGEGGSAAILARGDADAGAILLSCLDRGVFTTLLERTLDPAGVYRWTRIGPAGDSPPETLATYLAGRRARDPDMWIVELDIPSAERLAAEMIAAG